MKNLKVLVLIICIGTQILKGQFYGQRKYPHPFVVSDAKKTNVHSNGFVNAGYIITVPSSKIFSVLKTDSKGDFTSNDDFSVNFQVFKDASCNTLNTIVPNSFGTSVIETGNSSTPTTGSRYAVVTSCYGPSSGYGCVFVTLDQIGNIVTKAYYEFPNTTTNATKP